MPMSVKNGMASRASFCMMPNTRSGRASNRLEGPHTDQAEEEACGSQRKSHRKPASKNTSKPVNIRTKLLVNSSIIISLLTGFFLGSISANRAVSLGPVWLSTSGPSPK